MVSCVINTEMSRSWHWVDANTSSFERPAYWIAFGPHGPRAVTPPGENWRVFKYTMLGVGIAVVIFAILRQFAKEKPKTMTREWQQMTNEYLRVRLPMPPCLLSMSERAKGSLDDLGSSANDVLLVVPKRRADHRYFIRGL